jgi:hypothetical protein
MADRLHELGELMEVGGLDMIGHDPEFMRALDVPWLSGRGQDDHPKFLVPRVVPEPFQDLKSRFHGKLEVEEHERRQWIESAIMVGAFPLEVRHRFPSVPCDLDVVSHTRLLQPPPDEQNVVRIVLDHEET